MSRSLSFSPHTNKRGERPPWIRCCADLRAHVFVLLMLVPQSEYFYFSWFNIDSSVCSKRALNGVKFKKISLALSSSGDLPSVSWRFWLPWSSEPARFATFESRLAEGKTEKCIEKCYFHLECTNAHRHGAMLVVFSTVVCVFVKWICDVMSCRGKLKFQRNF